MQVISLPVGRTEINPRVASWTVELSEGLGPLVELIALGELDPVIQNPLEKRQAATTLAIRMDRVVAIALSQQIRELARSKGWPLPLEGERRA
jgi:hypothetical protein